MDTTTEFSDQAIVSGIKIGGQSETNALKALYEKYADFFTGFDRFSDLSADNSIVWEAVECLVHGLKNEAISFRENDHTIEFYLNQLARKIQSPDSQATTEITLLYEDKLVWDYYLMLLSGVEKGEHQLLSRIYGEGITTDDLAERLVAKGIYYSTMDVRTKKAELLDKIIAQL